MNEFTEDERRYAEAAHEEKRSLDRGLLTDPISVLRPEQAITVAPGEVVADAVRKMTEARQGAVLVVEAGRVAGIFTERDLLTRVVAAGLNAKELAVSDVMTADPECLNLDDTLGHALHKMSIGGYRTVPVVDADGGAAGVITQHDGVRYMVGFFPESIINQPPRSIEQLPPDDRHGG